MKTFIIFGIIVAVLSGCSTTSSYSPNTYTRESHDTSCISGNCTNGYGTFKYNNGDRYVGYFSDGKRNGQGTYSVPNKVEYFGNWTNGGLTGKCSCREGNGSWVSGYCRNTNNSLSFSETPPETKRDVSKKKIQNLLKSIQSM